MIDAQDFSGRTIMIFKELMTGNMKRIIEGRENVMFDRLIWSIKYRRKPDFTVVEIRARIITMLAISEKFTRDMNDAIRSYKTTSTGNNTKENSPKKTSPEKTSPERKLSPERSEEIYSEGSSSKMEQETETDEKFITEMWKEIE